MKEGISYCELINKRRKFFGEMEKRFLEGKTLEADIFYYYLNEDHIVLSHALFWVMSRSLKKALCHNKSFLLLAAISSRNAYRLSD